MSLNKLNVVISDLKFMIIVDKNKACIHLNKYNDSVLRNRQCICKFRNLLQKLFLAICISTYYNKTY